MNVKRKTNPASGQITNRIHQNRVGGPSARISGKNLCRRKASQITIINIRLTAIPIIPKVSPQVIIRDETNSRMTSKRNAPNRSAMPIQPNPNFEARTQRSSWRGQGHFSNCRRLRLRFRKSREQAGSDGNAAAAFSNFPLTASNAETNKLKNRNLLISG